MRHFTAAITLFLFTGLSAYALDSEEARESLKGLRGVYIVVEKLQPAVENAGLTVADLRTDIELKLRLAGIAVLTHEQWLAEPGGPYLYVGVNVLGHDPDLWPWSISVELEQGVALLRSPQVSVEGTTWGVEGVGVAGTLRLREVRNTVKDYVDQFINAYLSVNPKK